MKATTSLLFFVMIFLGSCSRERTKVKMGTFHQGSTALAYIKNVSDVPLETFGFTAKIDSVDGDGWENRFGKGRVILEPGNQIQGSILNDVSTGTSYQATLKCMVDGRPIEKIVSETVR